jgi:hypothetical protein
VWILQGTASDQSAQEVGSNPAGGLRKQLGKGKRARPIDGDEQREPAFFCLHLGNVHMDVAKRILLQLSLGRLVAFYLWETADAMALVAAVQGGPDQVEDAVLQGIEAVIQRQQRMPAKRNAHRFLFLRQHCGTQLLRPHRRIMHVLAPLPLRHRLWIDVVALSEHFQALLTMLYRSTHCCGRAGAAVEYLSHRSSRHGKSTYDTPSHSGTKYLG